MEHNHSRIFSPSSPAFFCNVFSPQLEQTCEVGSHRLITITLRPCISALASSMVLNARQPRSPMPLARFGFFIIPLTLRSSRLIDWFSRISLVLNLCRKSMRISLTRAWILATANTARLRLLLPFLHLESRRCKRASFLRYRFRGFGASTFVPSSSVAKVVIPRSTPMALSFQGRTSALTSTTKDAKYLPDASFITVTDDGAEGSLRLHLTFMSPILDSLNLSVTLKTLDVKRADWLLLRLLKRGICIFRPFLVPATELKKLRNAASKSLIDCCKGTDDTSDSQLNASSFFSAVKRFERPTKPGYFSPSPYNLWHSAKALFHTTRLQPNNLVS